MGTSVNVGKGQMEELLDGTLGLMSCLALFKCAAWHTFGLLWLPAGNKTIMTFQNEKRNALERQIIIHPLIYFF